jgi:hypothetical protein
LLAAQHKEEEDAAEEDPSLLELLKGGADADADADAEAEAEAEAEADIDPDDLEIIPPLFVQARALFISAEVTNADSIELTSEPPNEAELTKFLVRQSHLALTGFHRNQRNLAGNF